jgi:flagellar biosynthesis protein FlhF
MNVKRFTARTSRDALALVRQEFGDDAVVMSTRPCAEGVEVLAMAPESIHALERVGAAAQNVRPALAQRPQSNVVQPRESRAAPAPVTATPTHRMEPSFDGAVEQDVEQLQMSTLSFQDYVRQRMLKRRDAQLAAEASLAAEPPAPPPVVAPIAAARNRLTAAREVPVLREELRGRDPELGTAAPKAVAAQAAVTPQHPGREPLLASAPVAERAEQIEMMGELRSMRGLIEQRFGALAFMEKLQRQPRQAQLAQKLLDTGFSPALIRKLVESLPADVDEATWAAGVLERNLSTAERETALEDAGGVYALIGATGVGKTTSTAKLAAAFAARHGAAELGLVTLDAYRVAAHEQLRTYGRILGVPVHTAHDRASLEDLLDLLSGKRMVLIDTAGMAQRDSRTRELLEMISHRSINRLLVVNASAQGETIEDQLAAYGAPACRGVVLSKLDEAVKLGPALDSMIRHRLKVLAVANGQRVPEDWHRLSANALVQRALKSSVGAAWRLDGQDVNLIFAGMPASRPAAQLAV